MAVTFDEMLGLVSEMGSTQDKYGNEIPNLKTINVLCDVKSIDKNQYYRAGQQGLRLSYVFIINAFEYEGQKTVEYRQKKYAVVRAYQLDNGLLELTVAEKEGVTNDLP